MVTSRELSATTDVFCQVHQVASDPHVVAARTLDRVERDIRQLRAPHRVRKGGKGSYRIR